MADSPEPLGAFDLDGEEEPLFADDLDEDDDPPPLPPPMPSFDQLPTGTTGSAPRAPHATNVNGFTSEGEVSEALVTRLQFEFL